MPFQSHHLCKDPPLSDCLFLESIIVPQIVIGNKKTKNFGHLILNDHYLCFTWQVPSVLECKTCDVAQEERRVQNLRQLHALPRVASTLFY